MKHLSHIWVVASLLFFTFPGGVSAQFYAPETQFHDKVQRLFVVEAVRVLAWRENLNGQKFSEITYKLTTGYSGTNRTTIWDLDLFAGNSNKPVKTIHVSYPEQLLSEGPGFYRNVFNQIWSQGKWTSLPGLTRDTLNTRYWQGADLNGLSREEGLRAAFNLPGTNSHASEAEYAPKLAGLLTHVPLPSLCGGLTLDAMLLARGSAWLSLSETMLKDSPGNENWAPILFMAGRENAACQLWKKSVRADLKMEGRAALFEWWNFFVQRRHAREAFEFITDVRQRRFGMPMMTYYSRLEYLGSPLVEVLCPLYGSDGDKSLGRLYNYGGFLSASTDVGGGRILEGAWPAIFRTEWLKLLKDFPATSTDYTGYQDKLKNLTLPDPFTEADETDASLTGLKPATPLLQLGYEQGIGKLTPVATVTTRDLLNYGWEMNGLLMGARYYFVNQQWGVPELARTILDRATVSIDGQIPFFRNGEVQSRTFNLKDELTRLQIVDDLAWRVDVNIQPFSKDTTDHDGARQFYQRCWLRPYETRWQAWALWKAGLCDEMSEILHRYHNESGPKADILALEWIQDWYSEKDLETLPDLKHLKEEIAEGMLDATKLQVKVLFPSRYRALDCLARAQAWEKLFWQNPDSSLEYSIMAEYINSGAWKSAERFYRQAREIVSRDVEFSNILPPQIWMMGFLQDNEEAMNLAVEDSDTGSRGCMMTAVYQYAAQGQFDRVDRQLSEIIERYESEQGPRSSARVLKQFLPLIPALQDPKHPEHEKALDYFGKSDNGVIFRWLLIQKFKLPPQEAIRFLGGKETDRLRRVLVLYLENRPHQEIHEALVDYLDNASGNIGAARPLVCWAAGEIQNRSEEAKALDKKDLKPAGAQSIRNAVLAKLRQK